MAYTRDDLSAIYDRTSGYCHICKKKLAFSNYGRLGARGAWEVEHSKPRAGQGTGHRNNLYAACISCNRSKGTRSTRSARAQHGRTRAPLSVDRRREVKRGNAVSTGIAGALIGGMLGGPVGAIVGGALGAKVGHDSNPDEEE